MTTAAAPLTPLQQAAQIGFSPMNDTWQLQGTGIDAAALIEDQGPAVYFRGGEVFVAEGSSSNAEPIATLWPKLPTRSVTPCSQEML